MADRNDLYQAWRGKGYWQKLVAGDPERIEGLGDVYELCEPPDLKGEGLVIVDMSQVGFMSPRYFVGSRALYYALEGTAHCAVGDKDQRIKKGESLAVHADQVHFMASHKFVVALATAPLLDASHVVDVDELHPHVPFNKTLFRHIAYAQPNSCAGEL